jgi:hypothetical protein
MAFIPITIWQVFESGQWQFHHIEDGHIRAEHRTITPRRFQANGAKLWRHRRAYVNNKFEIVGPPRESYTIITRPKAAIPTLA